MTTKPEQPEGFISRRHRSVQKERTLLKRLEGLAAEGDFDGKPNKGCKAYIRHRSE